MRVVATAGSEAMLVVSGHQSVEGAIDSTVTGAVLGGVAGSVGGAVQGASGMFGTTPSAVTSSLEIYGSGIVASIQGAHANDTTGSDPYSIKDLSSGQMKSPDGSDC